MKKVFTLLTLVIATLAASLVFVPTAQAVEPNPTSPGTWTTVANCAGFNPIHSSMLPSGKILSMAGSGYNQSNSDAIKAGTMTVEQAWIYDPNTPTVCPKEVTLPTGVDLFCAGMTHLPDGRILVFGGTGNYGKGGSYPGHPDYYTGIKDTYVYSETLNTFEKLDDMAVARWYGTGVTRADGSIVVFGGLGENAEWTQNHQLFNPTTEKWTNLPTPPWKMPMYAGSALLPNGLFAYTGTYFGSTNGVNPMQWNPLTNTSTPITGLPNPTCRNQANTLFAYPKIYVIGGACAKGVTSSVGVLDVNKRPYTFTNAGYTNLAGTYQCGAVLPDRSLFISHGSNANAGSLLAAKRLPLDGTTWQTLAAPTVMRGYHSTCMVLKDGRVLTQGTNWNDGRRETKIEIYTPFYAQAGIIRPSVLNLGVAATKTACGTTALKAGVKTTAKVSTSNIVSATLTKLPSVTHQHDPNMRTVPLAVTPTGTGVTFTVPAASVYFPKGQYMLNLLDSRGVPTVAQMVSIGDTESSCCC